MAASSSLAASNGDLRLWTLNKEEELRLEVDADHTVTITVSERTQKATRTSRLYTPASTLSLTHCLFAGLSFRLSAPEGCG